MIVSDHEGTQHIIEGGSVFLSKYGMAEGAMEGGRREGRNMEREIQATQHLNIKHSSPVVEIE